MGSEDTGNNVGSLDNPWEGLGYAVETLAISASNNPDNFASKCVVTPIVTSCTFMMTGSGSMHLEDDKDQEFNRFEYGRSGNPTRNHLENYFAQIEGAKHALAFGSGVAALGAITLSLRQGDHVLSSLALYGGSFAQLKELARFGISMDMFLTSDPEDILRMVKPNTKMVYVESPSNPTLRLLDISALARGLRRISSNARLVVDNTFLTPLYQRSLTLGADIVMYSSSKYIGGHADIIGGLVATNSDQIFRETKKCQEIWGGIPSPFDCYLAIRSLKTLPLRMEKHCKTALKIARFLESHPKVSSVVHPGLKSHPQHDLALKQQLGHSGMMGFYIQGGFKEAAEVIANVRLIKRAPSLGADISLITIPARMSHIQLMDAERESLGITDNFIRLSVGLEGAQSLIQDLDQSLNKAIQ